MHTITKEEHGVCTLPKEADVNCREEYEWERCKRTYDNPENFNTVGEGRPRKLKYCLDNIWRKVRDIEGNILETFDVPGALMLGK